MYSKYWPDLEILLVCKIKNRNKCCPRLLTVSHAHLLLGEYTCTSVDTYLALARAGSHCLAGELNLEILLNAILLVMLTVAHANHVKQVAIK